MAQNLNIFDSTNKDLLNHLRSEIPILMTQIMDIIQLEQSQLLVGDVADIVATLIKRNEIFSNAGLKIS